eukprot:1840339-Amphidinium_carterae.1
MLLGVHHWEYSKRPRPGQAPENRARRCTDEPRNCTWIELVVKLRLSCVLKGVVAAAGNCHTTRKQARR